MGKEGKPELSSLFTGEIREVNKMRVEWLDVRRQWTIMESKEERV